MASMGDIKQVGKRYYVIEVNDNPNIEDCNEGGVLKDALYREVMGVFLKFSFPQVY